MPGVDVIDQILARRSRLTTTYLSLGLDKRLGKLRESLSYLERPEVPDTVREELLRHFPVATVAALEGFLRLLIEIVVDTGTPFIERIDGFKIKLDMDVVRAIGTKKISIGQLAAQSIPLSRLEHINDAFEKLLGVSKLWKRLDDIRLRVPIPFNDNGDKADTFLQVHEIVYQNVLQVIELRHVLAHEIAIDFTPKPTIRNMSIMLVWTLVFAAALEDLADEEIEKFEDLAAHEIET
jgi:hypothetical protein